MWKKGWDVIKLVNVSYDTIFIRDCIFFSDNDENAEKYPFLSLVIKVVCIFLQNGQTIQAS